MNLSFVINLTEFYSFFFTVLTLTLTPISSINFGIKALKVFGTGYPTHVPERMPDTRLKTFLIVTKKKGFEDTNTE